MEFLLAIIGDIQPGRLVESLIFLGVCWWKVKPHLVKVETRMDGIEKNLSTINSTMSAGFAAGEKRFAQIEENVTQLNTRVETLEHKGE